MTAPHKDAGFVCMHAHSILQRRTYMPVGAAPPKKPALPPNLISPKDRNRPRLSFPKYTGAGLFPA